MRYPMIEQVLYTNFIVNVDSRNFGGYVHDATEFPEAGLSKRRNLNKKLRWQSVKDSCVSQTVANPIGCMSRSRLQQTPKHPAAMFCGNDRDSPPPMIQVRSLTTNLHHTKVYFFVRNTLKEDDPSKCNIRVKLQTASRFSILCMFWNRRNSIVCCKEGYEMNYAALNVLKNILPRALICRQDSKEKKQCKDVIQTRTFRTELKYKSLAQPAMYKQHFSYTVNYNLN